MTTRAKLFSQLARSVDTSGTITSDGISSTVSLGATVYDSIGELPTSGYTAGEQAFVKSTSRLYINSGVGWYNVAVINNTPTIQSILDSDGGTGPFSLATDGTATTITITAQDSDGDALTYTASADSDFNGLATISQVSNVFTITPLSQDSATTSSGTITFSVTDGINIATPAAQTFTISFVNTLWDETTLSIGTSSTNSLDNSTFIDRSTNVHTVTPTGSPVQTAFHPYLDNWSNYFDGADDGIAISSYGSTLDMSFSGEFTIEYWYYQTASQAYATQFGLYQTTGDHRAIAVMQANNANPTLYISSNGNGFSTRGLGGKPLNEWTHVAITRDSNDDIRLYRNGVQQGASLNFPSIYSGGATPFVIGGQWNGTEVYREFPGNISNFRFVKGTALYTSDFTPSTKKLTAINNTALLTCQSNRFIDNSTNGLTITSYGNSKVSAFNPFGQESEYAVGENKGSVDLNGDYLSLSSSDVGNLGTADYTVQFWIYKRGTTNDCIIDLRGGDLSHGVSVEMDTKVTVFYGGSPFQDTGSFDNYAWNHIAICRSSAVLKGFINGEQIFSVADTNDRNNTNNTSKIGVNYSNAQPTDALLSDIKVTHTAEYTSAFTPPVAPLGNTNAKLYVPMDNAGIYDKTGNHTLTPVGDASTSTSQTKFADTAMYFDGTGDKITTSGANYGDFGTGDFTIEFWMRAESLSGYNSAIADDTYASSSTPNAWCFYLQGPSLNPWKGGSSLMSGGTLSLNTWHHLAWTRSNGTMYLFLDGTQVDTTTDSTSFNHGDIIVGSNSTDYYLQGYLENVQILKGVAKYTANFTPPTQTQGRTYQAED